MKRILKIILFLALSVTASSQQLPQVTQYLFNAYSINPAVAGTGDNIQINSINRYQWEGIVDAPRTYTLSFQSPLKNNRSGIGTYLYTDIVGPSRRIGIQGSYSYILPLKDNLKLSMALSAGMMQFAIDGHKIDLAEENDIVIQNSLGSRVLFDAKFGLYLYSDKFYLGLALPQLAQNKLRVYEGITDSQSFLTNHYYANVGYKIKVSENVTLEPSSLVKYVSPVPIKIDGNLKFEYQKKLWIAGGWRSNDAVNIMFGYNWNENLVFGYGHDFTTSDLSEYSGSTHEILLGIKISRKKKSISSNL